MAVTNVVCA